MPDRAQKQHEELSKRPIFEAFVTKPEDEVTLRAGLSEFVGIFPSHQGNIKTAIEHLQNGESPQVLLVDLSGISDLDNALDALANVCAPDVRLLAIGEINDVEFYRKLTRDLGVTEYLCKPLTREAVTKLFGSQFNADVAVSTDTTGRNGEIITVCGVRGGVGASTIAVNLALQVAEIGKGHVAILDPQLRSGTTALMLGIRPGSGLRSALEDPNRMDSLFLDRVAIPVSERVRLVAAEEPFDSVMKLVPEGMGKLLALLQKRFNHVIVDMRLPPSDIDREILKLSKKAILVMEPDVVGIRDAVASRKLLTASGTKVSIILNNLGLPGTLKQKLIEEGLGSPLDAVIPYLPKELPRSADLGVPGIQKSRGFRKALNPISLDLCGTGAKKSSGILSRILGRR